MKTFLKMLLAVILGFFLFFLLFFLIIGGIASTFSKEEEPAVSKNSVLEIDLSSSIRDRAVPPSFNSFITPFGMSKPSISTPLRDALCALDYAIEDDNIRGILIRADGFALDLSTAEELRLALQHFKNESGKFIYAYATSFNQAPYFVASVADSVFLNPGGGFMWYGLSSKVLYQKRMFEKLGVEPQIVRHGKYKSAVEPLILDKMSDANRHQLTSLLNANMDYLTECVSESRGKSVDFFKQFADKEVSASPQEAQAKGLIDAPFYIDQVDSLLAVRCELEKDAEPKFVSLSDYTDYAKKKIKVDFKAPKVAVLYAEGGIDGSEGLETTIGSKAYIKEIQKLRRDSTIKAVVLRVNSPGGSALASEEIWRELHKLKREKPLVISMGHLAASGGYYISCVGDKIYADRLTLTGSIGVFARFFTFKKLLEDKAGIVPQTVKTNEHSDMLSPFRPMDEAEHEIMRRQIEEIYKLFTQRVSDGRGLPVAQVDSLGQGRVWSGIEAEKNGLVDGIGGINFSIEQAAELANLESYQVREYPSKEDSFWDQMLRKTMKNIKIVYPSLKIDLPEKVLNEMEWLQEQKGIRAELPYQLEIR